MGTMTIDGRKVEFTDERNVLSVIRKAGIDTFLRCAITQNFPPLAPAVSVRWRMTEGEPSPPVRKSPGMGWLFIRIQRKSENTEN